MSSGNSTWEMDWKELKAKISSEKNWVILMCDNWILWNCYGKIDIDRREAHDFVTNHEGYITFDYFS
jgi:hypothetical protein